MWRNNKGGKWVKQILFLFFFFGLYFPLPTYHLPFTVVLAEEGKFVYNSHGKRDPFYPIISEGGEFLASPGHEPNTDGNLTLEGIVWEESGDSVAIINGTVVKPGEQISGYEIVWIKKDELLLRSGEEEILLALPMMEEEKGK